MATKLYIQNNYLVVQEGTETPNYIPSKDVDFQPQKDNPDTIVIHNIETNGEAFTFASSDAQDESGTPIGTTSQVIEFLTANTGNFSSAAGGSAVSGWGVYTDTALTEGSPLSLTGGAAYVNLPNNAGSKLETQKPDDVSTFYDEGITKITGRNGDGINITLSFAVKPTTNQVTRVTVVPDINGAIGEIEDYARDVSFSRGQNVIQRYLSSFNAYTLDTWEVNGAQLKIKADQNCDIFNVRYLITRTHKARPTT